MKTSNDLKIQIMDKIKDSKSPSFSKTEYDERLPKGYIGQDHKPTEKLIFLKFDDFNGLIKYFFEKFDKKEIEDFKKPKKQPQDENAIGIKNNKKVFSEKFLKTYAIIRDTFGANLQAQNEIYICPYCEKNYINITEIDENKIIKSDLDHFYSKSLYPFLACSIENLIPSCSVCNAKLKGNIDFYEVQHINPLQNRVFESIIFNYNYSGIYMEYDSNLSDKHKQYLDTFKIQEIYAIHSEILNDIQEKYKKYTKAKQKSLLSTLDLLTEEEILNIIFHEYRYEQKVHPLRKLKKDLYENIVLSKKLKI